jgi:Transposase DDE domain
MDHGVFRKYTGLLRELGAYRRRDGQAHSDGAVLAVYFYSVLCRRPVYWACQRTHWPRGLWKGSIPSQSCMSRRLREPGIIELRNTIERLVRPPTTGLHLAASCDGKPIEIALHSQDAHARTGRGVGHVARGYKIHALVSVRGTLLSWRLTPLNISERAMAQRMLKEHPNVCYVLADSYYDTNQMAASVRLIGAQLVTPRKKSDSWKPTGKRRQDPGRLRSIAMTEHDATLFTRELFNQRTSVERFFAQWSNSAGGLTSPPIWVRTYPRIHAWVQTTLVIAYLKGSIADPHAAAVA